MEPTGAAVVTGASRGIGRAVARELARRGFAVHATMRDPSAGADLADELGPAAGPVTVEALDVTRPGDWEPPAGLRVLVNNAAVEGENLPVEHTPAEEWRRQFDTNVFGLVEVTRRALPALRAGGGVVVNVTSAGLLVPMPFFAVYRATKAAVQAVGDSLRAELAPFGIRVLEVLPGPIETDMLAASATRPEAHRHTAYRTLAERVAELRAGIEDEATPSAAAARAIVDAVLDDDGPDRIACDPVGEGLLTGWSSTPDAEWQAAFLGPFRPAP